VSDTLDAAQVNAAYVAQVLRENDIWIEVPEQMLIKVIKRFTSSNRSANGGINRSGVNGHALLACTRSSVCDPRTRQYRSTHRRWRPVTLMAPTNQQIAAAGSKQQFSGRWKQADDAHS
jgi:hypothetical protein